MSRSVAESSWPESSRLAFVHIPKCGGQSIQYRLAEYFGAQRCLRVGRPEFGGDIEQAASIPDWREALRRSSVVYGHYTWPFLKDTIQRTDSPRFMPICVVREPLARAISEYWYCRGYPEHPLWSLCQEVSISEYLLEHHEHNVQCRTVAGTDLFGEALERIQTEYEALGALDEIDDFGRMLADALRQPRLPVPHINLNRAQDGKPAPRVGPRTTSRFYEKNVADLRLYWWIREHWREHWRLGGGSEQLAAATERSSRPIERVVLTVGMRKSASTFAFQLTRDFFEQSCTAFAREETFPEGLRHPFVPDLDHLDQLINATPAGKITVRKTHLECSRRLAEFVDAAVCYPIVQIRDPFDVVASLLDAGETERRKPPSLQRDGFVAIRSIEDALPIVLADIDTARRWIEAAIERGIPCVDFEFVTEQPTEFLELFASRFELDGNPSAVVDRYERDRSLIEEYNQGKPGRGARFISEAAASGLREQTESFRKFLQSVSGAESCRFGRWISS